VSTKLKISRNSCKSSSERFGCFFASRVAAVEKIRKHFYLYHVHLNNWEQKPLDLPGVGKVPKGVEASFIRKGLVSPGPAPYDNHADLDQPCNPKAPEVTPSMYGPY